MELTYSEIENILDTKYITVSATGYILPPGIHKITDVNLTLTCLLPDRVKINIVIDDIRLKSSLTTNNLIKFC